MKKTTVVRHRFAIALSIGLALSMSAPAESRPRGGTEIEQLAADLARILGSDAVELRRGSAAPREIDIATPQPAGVEAIVLEMNRHRARAGLPALQWDARLAAAAEDRAEDMVARGYFAHVDPEGRSPFLTVKAHGYRFRAVGENLAVGYPTARSIVEGWMASPGHRANILATDYREVGIAIHPRAPKRPYAGPTVVAMYGLEKG